MLLHGVRGSWERSLGWSLNLPSSRRAQTDATRCMGFEQYTVQLHQMLEGHFEERLWLERLEEDFGPLVGNLDFV